MVFYHSDTHRLPAMIALGSSAAVSNPAFTSSDNDTSPVLEDGKTVTDATKKVIEELQSLGVLVVLCSDQPFAKAKAVAEAAGIRPVLAHGNREEEGTACYIVVEGGAGAFNLKTGSTLFESKSEVQSDSDDVNKSLGLSELCKAIGVPLEKVWAFGDDFDDLRMMEIVGRGVLMVDAGNDVAARAKHFDRTEYPNEEDGVARYLRKHLWELENEF